MSLSVVSDFSKLNFDNACAPGINGNNCMTEETKDILLKNKDKHKKYTAKEIENILSNNKHLDELNLLFESEDILGKEKILEEYLRFKSVGPTNTNYFNNFVEDQILRRYKHFEPSFYHVPVQLMDFPDSDHTFNTELRDIVENLGSDLGIKYTTFGAILNTLESKGNLSKVGHWVAMFGDLRGEINTIEYFNSSGRQAPTKVFKWMEDTAKKIQKLTGKKTIATNATNIVHQKSNTECGAYSSYYITYRLFAGHYKDFRKVPIPDNLMTKFRSSVLNSDSKIKNKTLLKLHRLI